MIINLSCSSTALLQSQMVRQLPTTQSRALFSRLLRNALPGFRYSTPASEEGEQKEKRGGENATGRDRAREENGEAPRGEDQGLAKGLFHHWADHHRQDQRRGFVVEFFHQIPQDSKDPHYDAVADIVADAVGADEAEQEDEREQDRVGHSEEPGPHWYERQIQDQKHGVADVHAGDNPPEDIGGLLHQKGTGLKPVNHQRPKQDRHDRVGGNAKRQKRDEGAAGSSVVGGFWPGHALDGSFAEPLGVFGRPLFNGVRDEGSDDGTSAGKNAQEKPQHRSPQDRHGLEAPVLAAW